MHYVAVSSFTFNGTAYNIGDGIFEPARSLIRSNPYYLSFVVNVSDGGASQSTGATTTTTTGGTDMPIVAGSYNVPASASTSGVLSAVPVRIIDITNTDSNAQGARITLFDTNNVNNIPSAHQIGSWELGSSQTVTKQYLTSIGLVWEIQQGSGGATALNSIGSGVDITYAAN